MDGVQENTLGKTQAKNISETLPWSKNFIIDSAFCTITVHERKTSPVYFICQNYNSDFLFLIVCPKPADPTPTLRTVINRGQLFL